MMAIIGLSCSFGYCCCFWLTFLIKPSPLKAAKSIYVNLISINIIIKDMMIWLVKLEDLYINVKLEEFEPEQKVEKNAMNTFNWTQEENFKYAYFLKENLHLFKSEKKRRALKVFKLVSEAVKTRTYVQCKSHHQKMLLKYGGNHRIIKKILGS